MLLIYLKRATHIFQIKEGTVDKLQWIEIKTGLLIVNY